jgi:hypothetical protein
LIHRFDAQASWQGNWWIISLFLSLRAPPREWVVRRKFVLLLIQQARRVVGFDFLCSFVSFVVQGLFSDGDHLIDVLA